MRIIKQVLLYTTIIAVSLLAILVVFGFIFQDKIVSSVISEINKSLNSEIKVQEFDFSLISDFPNASVNMNEVTGFESSNFSASPDSLFHFKTLSLSFNVLDVIQGNYILHSISVNEGFANLEIDKNGIENFLIVEPDTSSKGNFFLNLEQVNLKDCTVGFRDFRGNDQYEFYFPYMEATGVFTSSLISNTLNGKTRVNKLILDKMPYLTNENASVDIGIVIDLANQTFEIERGFITLREKYDFDVKGKSVVGRYQYTFKATELDLRQAETLIPKKHIAFINAYEVNGTANVFLDLSKKDKDKRPTIKGAFDVWSGDITNKETKESIKIHKAKGRYDLGKSARPVTTQIWVDKFELDTPEGHAMGKIAISNLKHPWYKIEAIGLVDLLEMSNFYSFSKNFSMWGSADFDIRMTGSIQDLTEVIKQDVGTIQGAAKINLRDVGFAIENMPSIDSVTTHIVFNQNDAVIENFDGLIAGSPTVGTFKVSHWLDFLMDENQTIRIEGELNTQKIETSKWVSNSNTSSEFSFPKNIQFRGHVFAREFIHKETNLANLSSTVSLSSTQLQLTNTSFNAFSGDLKLDLKMIEHSNKMEFSIKLFTQNVDVQKLLSTYHDFGQKMVTQEHLRGRLTSSWEMNFFSDKKMNVSNESILLEGDLMLLEGEMIENQFLTQIPAQIESNKIVALFVNLDAFEKRLHHIKFDTISNHLSIKNSVLTIPKMHISSTALQIDVAGTHSFSNKVDYYLSFSLTEVLTRDKKVTTDYGYIEDDNRGNRMMFLHLYTKNGEIQVDLDKEGARKHRQSRSKREAQETKSILKEEFGFFKNDSTVTTATKEPTFDYEIDLGEFAEDTVPLIDTTTVIKDSTKIKKTKKKKSKKEKEEEFEEFDFDDDDY